MGRNEYGQLGGICGYAKVRYEERVETKRRKRSFSEPITMGRSYTGADAKLNKPPTVQAIHGRPRNRLQKRILTPSTLQLPVYLFILAYEPYPYNTKPSEFLGVHSTINSVTAAALRHGAYTFSREGLLDGSEYLSSTGRIRIMSQVIQHTGVAVAIPDRSRSLEGEHVRLDIPHPKSQESVTLESKSEPKETVFLAIHKGPRAAVCIGLFTRRSLAWGACLKDKAWYARSGALVEEERSVGVKNMPQISARLVGSGRHTWIVQPHEINCSGP